MGEVSGTDAMLGRWGLVRTAGGSGGEMLGAVLRDWTGMGWTSGVDEGGEVA
jgi:hypothetical protein